MTEQIDDGRAPVDADYVDLVQDIKVAINEVAGIYPTAFHLYDEPLDRVAHKLAHLFRSKYGDAFSVDTIVNNKNKCPNGWSKLPPERTRG